MQVQNTEQKPALPETPSLPHYQCVDLVKTNRSVPISVPSLPLPASSGRHARHQSSHRVSRLSKGGLYGYLLQNLEAAVLPQVGFAPAIGLKQLLRRRGTEPRADQLEDAGRRLEHRVQDEEIAGPAFAFLEADDG